jgi:DGQHR domain-containing protein
MTTKKAKAATSETKKKTGIVKTKLSFPAIEFTQGQHKMYMFAAKASLLYSAVSINRRINDKDEGYQRTLALGRIQAVSKYFLHKRAVPSAIVIAFENAHFDGTKGTLTIPPGTDVGWVIDGQHRLAGAEMAARGGTDVDLGVVAFIGLSKPQQIEQFVTINREAKNVPTSLYLDLLGKLPNKSPADAARERTVDIANALNRDEGSPFYTKIAITIGPKQGQISLVNFVRKVMPQVADKGFLNAFTEMEQRKVVANYFQALHQVFPLEFESKASVFFRTVGFGALWNVFPTVFGFALKYRQGFEVKDAVAILKRVENFDFGSWKEYGSGTLAENNAADDLKVALNLAFAATSNGGALRV